MEVGRSQPCPYLLGPAHDPSVSVRSYSDTMKERVTAEGGGRQVSKVPTTFCTVPRPPAGGYLPSASASSVVAMIQGNSTNFSSFLLRAGKPSISAPSDLISELPCPAGPQPSALHSVPGAAFPAGEEERKRVQPVPVMPAHSHRPAGPDSASWKVSLTSPMAVKLDSRFQKWGAVEKQRDRVRSGHQWGGGSSEGLGGQG